MNDLNVFEESNFQQAVKIAGTLAKSTIVPMHFRGKPEEIFAALVLGAELGFKPMAALSAIVMIQGQATLKAQTMLSMVRARCPKAIISISVNEEEKTATCRTKRDDNDPGYTAVWNFEKAKAMGLSHKDNYLKQLTNMLKWRAISEALRITFPDILQGLYASEEIEDIEITPVKETMSQTLRREVEQDYPTPKEELECGPLFRFSHGKHIGKQFKDLPMEELEAYRDYLENKQNKNHWQLKLYEMICNYIERFDDYKEMLLEMKND